MDKGISLQKFTSIETLLKILNADGGFLFRKISEFNDAFEAADISDNDKYKVLCFSKCTTSVLMWAHYGDSHKGCKIVLNLSKYREQGIDFKKVEYKHRNDRKKLSESTKIITKGKRWEYEHEYRLIYDEKLNSSCLSFKKEAVYLKPYIKCIWFGCNIDVKNEDYKKILKIIKENNDNAIKNRRKKKDFINVFKCKLSENGYNVEKDKNYNYEDEIKRL